MSISLFLAGEGWQMVFESIDQPGQSSEVERNPKWAFHFFWLERGGRWCSSPSTSTADHQKLNIIQKQAFHFFGWRGVVDGVRVHWPARLIIRTKMSHWPEISTFSFLGGGGVHQPEPKCYIDLRSKLFHSLGGGGYISQNQNVTLTWDLNFSIPGGGGGGTSARTKMSRWPEISTFPFLGGGGGTSAGRSEKCKVYR